MLHDDSGVYSACFIFLRAREQMARSQEKSKVHSDLSAGGDVTSGDLKRAQSTSLTSVHLPEAWPRSPWWLTLACGHGLFFSFQESVLKQEKKY